MTLQLLPWWAWALWPRHESYHPLILRRVPFQGYWADHGEPDPSVLIHTLTVGPVRLTWKRRP